MNMKRPLDGLLKRRLVNTLERHGIKTVEQLKEAYPKKLMRIEGFGLTSLRAVEAAFFPDKNFEAEVKSPRRRKAAPVLFLDNWPFGKHR